MFQTKFKSAYILSILVAVLATAASLGGLFIENLYRDNHFVTLAWFGSDIVTLVFGVPLLIAGLVLSSRGSSRGVLIWVAALGYMLYNYAFYMFGAAFNPFFLFFVAICALSTYALIYALANLDVHRLSRSFHPRTPVKWASAFLIFIALIMFGMVELGQTLTFITSGQLPSIVVDSAHPTSVVFALDLWMIMPAMVLGAVWLWKRQPWGFVLAPMMLFKGVTYMLALILASVLGNYDPLTPFYGFICAGSLLFIALLLGNLKSSKDLADQPAGKAAALTAQE